MRKGCPSRSTVDPQLARDLGGRRLLVAGDHHGTNARLAAGGDGGFGLVAERVAHADQADEDQVLGEVLLVVALRQFAIRQAENAQRRTGQLLVRLLPAPAVIRREGRHSSGPHLSAARSDQRPRRPLDKRHRPTLRRAMHGDHALAGAVERHFAEARKVACQGGLVHPCLFRRDDQGRLGRVAQHGLAAVGAFHFGIVAQHADSQGQREVLVGARVHGLVAVLKRAHRLVPRAGHFDAALVQHVDAHGHLVLGQCPGLVGADDGGGAQRLDGGEPADERAHPGHALHPQRQRHGGHGGQPLGHAAMARERPISSMCQKSVAPRSQPARTMTAHSANTTTMSRRPSRASFCSSGVARVIASSIRMPILPTSVCAPVAVTSNRPRRP